MSNLGSKTKELWKNPEYRKRMSEAHMGNAAYWKGKSIPQEAKDKMRDAKLKNPTRYWLNKTYPPWVGENNPSYIHGKSLENKEERGTLEYKIWRRQVFARDNFTCQICGQQGGRLHADHIKPFAIFKNLRLELSNGRTLCVPCHKKTDTYLKKFPKEMYLPEDGK